MRTTLFLLASALLLLAAVHSQRTDLCCMPDVYTITQESERTEYYFADNIQPALFDRKNITSTSQLFLDVKNNKTLFIEDSFTPGYRKEWDLTVYDAPRSRFARYIYNQTSCFCYQAFFPVSSTCFVEIGMEWETVKERTIGNGLKVKTYQLGYKHKRDPSSISEDLVTWTFTFEGDRCIPISFENELYLYAPNHGHQSVNTVDEYFDYKPTIEDPSVFDIPKHCPPIETCRKQSQMDLQKVSADRRRTRFART